MLSCQEMSHAPPITLEMTAMTQDQMYQGTESVAAETLGGRSGLHLETLRKLSLPWRAFIERVTSTSMTTCPAKVAVYTLTHSAEIRFLTPRTITIVYYAACSHRCEN